MVEYFSPISSLSYAMESAFSVLDEACGTIEFLQVWTTFYFSCYLSILPVNGKKSGRSYVLTSEMKSSRKMQAFGDSTRCYASCYVHARFIFLSSLQSIGDLNWSMIFSQTFSPVNIDDYRFRQVGSSVVLRSFGLILRNF